MSSVQYLNYYRPVFDQFTSFLHYLLTRRVRCHVYFISFLSLTINVPHNSRFTFHISSISRLSLTNSFYIPPRPFCNMFFGEFLHKFFQVQVLSIHKVFSSRTFIKAFLVIYIQKSFPSRECWKFACFWKPFQKRCELSACKCEHYLTMFYNLKCRMLLS